MVLTYAIIKGKMMILKERPSIATFVEKAIRTEENDQLSLKELSF